MAQWLETLLTLGGGALILEVSRLIGQVISEKGKTTEKKTVDETELSKILLDQNQARYDSILKDIQDFRLKEGELEKRIRHLELENLHARHLIGVGPVESLPLTRELFLRSISENTA